MSLLRRQPVTPPERRSTCPQCAWYSYKPADTLDHLLAVHINRRLAEVSPNPGRRVGDRAARSPWVQQALAAGDRNEGLSRRSRLS